MGQTFRNLLYRSGLAIAIIAALGMCTKFAIKSAYNNLEVVAMLRLDSLLNLTEKQKQSIRPVIRKMHSVHRNEELPKYKATLLQIKSSVRDGLTQEEMNSFLDVT